MENKNIKKIVRESYGRIAKQNSNCCSLETSCCGSNKTTKISKSIGYTDDDINTVPEGANLGLGCGNPVALASLKEGEIVLDLGSGAGFDCFLASNKVGASGKVIGVDMTPEMLEKARENALKGNYRNVEFRLGEIDNLPVADNFVDIVISNCVINLTPDKKRVFEEAYRAIKSGGRIMISDIVLLKKLDLPDAVIDILEAYGSCVTGAIIKDDYINAIKGAGFINVKITDESIFPTNLYVDSPDIKQIIENIDISLEEAKKIIKNINNSIASIKVYGEKPLK
jgi:SAM-dependent methyltransferase